MIDSTVVVAIVSGLCVAIPSLVATVISNRNNNSLVVYRLAKLEESVNKHNQVIERMAIVERDVKSAWNRIDEIREDVHTLEEQMKKGVEK